MKLSKINQPSTLSQTYNVSFLEANRVPTPILLSENGTCSSREHPADASTTQSSLLHQSWCSYLRSSHQTLPAQVHPHRQTLGTSPVQHAAFVKEQERKKAYNSSPGQSSRLWAKERHIWDWGKLPNTVTLESRTLKKWKVFRETLERPLASPYGFSAVGCWSSVRLDWFHNQKKAGLRTK